MRQTVEKLSYDDAGGSYWRIAGTLHGVAGSALAVPYRLTFSLDGPSLNILDFPIIILICVRMVVF